MTSTTDEIAPTEPERATHLGTVARIGAAAAALVPLLYLLTREFTGLGDRSIPCCDYAALDLGTSAFLRGEQFTGLYSRQGWRHPGPAPFLWNAPFRLVFGDSFASARIGMVVLAIVAVATVLWVLHRRLPTMAYVTGATVLTYWTMRFDIRFLAEPWNPEMAMLWVLVTIAAATMAWRRPGSAWLVATIAAGSMAIQCHLSAAPIVIVASVPVVIAAWRAREDRAVRIAALAAAILTLAIWSLPLWDLAFGEGNLWHIITVDDSGHAGGFAWSTLAVDLVRLIGLGPSRQGFAFGAASPFLDDHRIDLVTAIVAIASLILAARVVRDRRRRPLLAGVVVLSLGGLLLTSALLVVSGGEYWPYVLLPIIGLGPAILIAGLVAFVLDLPPDRSRIRSPIGAVEGAALATMFVVLLTQVPTTTNLDDYTTPALRDITAQILDSCDRLPDPSLVVISDEVAWTDAITMIAAIERCSTVRVYEHLGFVAGEPYVWQDDDQANVLIYPGSETRTKGTVVARNDAFLVLSSPFHL